MSAVRDGLVSLAGFLAERSVSRMEMCTHEKDGTHTPWRAILVRHTDLPGLMNAALSRGAAVDLRVPQLDVTLRVWIESGVLRAGCEPGDHPILAEVGALGLG